MEVAYAEWLGLGLMIASLLGLFYLSKRYWLRTTREIKKRSPPKAKESAMKVISRIVERKRYSPKRAIPIFGIKLGKADKDFLAHLESWQLSRLSNVRYTIER